jgi:hypothetical protein
LRGTGVHSPAGAWSWPLTSVSVELYFYSPNTPNDVGKVIRYRLGVESWCGW